MGRIRFGLILLSVLLAYGVSEARTGAAARGYRAPQRGYQRLSKPLRRHLQRLPRVRAGSGHYAVFDADHTLWNTDVGEGFFRFLVQGHHLPRTQLAREAKRLFADQQAGRPGVSDRLVYERVVQAMAGMKESTVESLAEQYFAREARGEIFKPMRALIHRLRAKGWDPIIISGSAPQVVRAGIKAFGVGIDPANVIGMTTAVERGVMTDRLTTSTWLDGKVQALKQRFPHFKAIALMAGDSYGDQPLQQFAVEQGGRAVLINGKRELREAARQRPEWIIEKLGKGDTDGATRRSRRQP